ncbi:hypothetical protein ACCS66_39070, partial [Rhizobium ruizarguesonis]
GADVITCHVDSPKVVVETAAVRGAFVCGYHANQSPLAPEKYLTGALVDQRIGGLGLLDGERPFAGEDHLAGDTGID